MRTAFAARAALSWTSVGARPSTRGCRSNPSTAPGELPLVRPSGGQGSHVVGALAGATALAVVPVGVEVVAEGGTLTCLPIVGQDRPHVR